MPKSRSYKEDLIKVLQDSDEASAYLNAALEAGDYEAFVIALRNVADAQEGIAALSQNTGLNRESLYRTLSEKGNPALSSLTNILQALGYRLSVIRTETLQKCEDIPNRWGVKDLQEKIFSFIQYYND